MTDTIVAQHTPAVKVGGRRLSLSTKHRPHAAPETSPTTSIGNTNTEPEVPAATDYPRPPPPGEEREPHAPPHHDDEVPLRKEKLKHGLQEKDFVRWKAETTRPTRDAQGAAKSLAGGARIAQPAGKGFGA